MLKTGPFCLPLHLCICYMDMGIPTQVSVCDSCTENLLQLFSKWHLLRTSLIHPGSHWTPPPAPPIILPYFPPQTLASHNRLYVYLCEFVIYILILEQRFLGVRKKFILLFCIFNTWKRAWYIGVSGTIWFNKFKGHRNVKMLKCLSVGITNF